MSENENALTIVEDAPAEVVPTDLLGASPAARLEEARRVSDLLAPIIRERNLSIPIQGKEYVLFEGWTLLGSLLGVFPSTESCVPLEGSDGVWGFEARVVARTLSGQVVGTAIARCTRDERSWANRDEYALASMAQTRAGAKALRMPLGFVMQLAGYNPTPYDEMPSDAPATPTPSNGVISASQRSRLYAKVSSASGRIGVPKADVDAFAKGEMLALGCKSSTELTKEPYESLCLTIDELTLEDLEKS